MQKLIGALFMAFFLISCRSVQAIDAPAASPQKQNYAPGQIIVKLKDDADLAAVDHLIQKYKASSIEPLFQGNTDLDAIRKKFPQRAKRAPQNAVAPNLSKTYLIKIDATADVPAAVAEFANDPHVEYAQPNYIATISSQNLL